MRKIENGPKLESSQGFCFYDQNDYFSGRDLKNIAD